MSSELVGIPKDMTNFAARADAQYVVWLCGVALESLSMRLRQKLCHTLGGTFNLPHAELYAMMLPYSLAYNADAAPEATRCIARALGVDNASAGLFELLRESGLPTSPAALDMPEEGLDRALELAVANPYPNPRALARPALRHLLVQAYDGQRPN